MISIKGLNKAEVLVALYNTAKAQGLGLLHCSPKLMTKEEAQQILDDGQTDFDYVNGRVMKVNLSGEEFEERLFDRDNGEGAAKKAIDAIR